ncbi:hypothetical protein ACGFIU_11355 [Rhodococcus oryzae]|uniref:hypothetical protein n=1 Tax=Rhodococcus oryzae TaxID=2571143 RepID=UPI0037175A0F
MSLTAAESRAAGQVVFQQHVSSRLTESLEVGYRLSPRGRRVLDTVFADGAGA